MISWFVMQRLVPGIEPGTLAWESEMLPLHQAGYALYLFAKLSKFNVRNDKFNIFTILMKTIYWKSIFFG